jgi:hypothetical protein
MNRRRFLRAVPALAGGVVVASVCGRLGASENRKRLADVYGVFRGECRVMSMGESERMFAQARRLGVLTRIPKYGA